MVKVEPPRGDDARAFPPYSADGESAFFHALNRGKRSATLEADDARRLVEGADVVIENLGDFEARLGFGPSDMPERFVWCSITGHGVGRGGRAMDPSLQASMGLMELTGEPGGPPLRVPVPLIDFMTGVYATNSILAALWQAERSGRGAHLDCALVDSTATFTSTVGLFSLSGEFEPGRIGAESYLRVPSAVFAASDGAHVQIVALHERHWEGICEALGHREWLDDPRSDGNDARLRTATSSTNGSRRSSLPRRRTSGCRASTMRAGCASGSGRSARRGETRCWRSGASSVSSRMARSTSRCRSSRSRDRSG